MAQEFDEVEAFFNRRTDKTVVGKGFADALSGRRMRIASRIVAGQEEGLRFATIKEELVLRETNNRRSKIKAVFFEDDRGITQLTIQKFNSRSASDEIHFTFLGREVRALLEFIAGVRTLPLDQTEKVHISDTALRDIVLNKLEAGKVFENNVEIFLQLARDADLAHDFVALGYRRKQLLRFDRLLNDAEYFGQEQKRLLCKPEEVWQKYFENNTWIFGYGLTYQFLSGLDQRKLEQYVVGFDVSSRGKRVDALMKTRGKISSLCFVEIKHHNVGLMREGSYRPGVWQPTVELSGAVAQVHTTVHEALHNLGQKLEAVDKLGYPTGEHLFNIEPKSFLVVGTLSEFIKSDAVHAGKFRDFELFRKNTWRPEIVTFDELLERARFIVEHTPAQQTQDVVD